MKIINLSEGNCRSCYKCLNSCGVKAIKMVNEQAEIVDERCIACGHCVVVCPQGARKFVNDVEQIKTAIKKGKTVIASVAPSFPGAFNLKCSGQIVKALKMLGFSIVEETSIGAEVVTTVYKDYLQSGKYDNFITTSCPSVNYLIEKYYPDLIKYMAPAVSPMIAHGKILKKKYGEESYVVFIGPCVSKKAESKEKKYDNIINAVITFNELSEWFTEENIAIGNLESQEFDRVSGEVSSEFPLLGGIIKNISNNCDLKLDAVNVDGIEECKEIFKSISDGKLTNVLVEANVCKGGCIGGPSMVKSKSGYYERQKKVREYVRSKKKIIHDESLTLNKKDYYTVFENRQVVRKTANEEEIKKILESVGKYSKDDELNCGGCGYNTCRDKAQAVYEGMSEAYICLPYLRSKAESMKNVIFENSPNLIAVVDENLNMLEINPKAEQTFKISSAQSKGQPVSNFVDESYFATVKENEKGDTMSFKIAANSNDIILLSSIKYLPKEKVFIAIMTDVTLEEKNRQKLDFVKEQTFDAAEEVIKKQMRVAQEIAGLLGETTGETKVILTKLKNLYGKEKRNL